MKDNDNAAIDGVAEKARKTAVTMAAVRKAPGRTTDRGPPSVPQHGLNLNWYDSP